MLSNPVLICYEFDDVLFPTTIIRSTELHLVARTSWPDPLADEMRTLETSVFHLLAASLHRGIVKIITHASKSWVELSCSRYMPSVWSLIIYENNIEVISTMDNNNNLEGDKIKAFKLAINAANLAGGNSNGNENGPGDGISPFCMPQYNFHHRRRRNNSRFLAIVQSDSDRTAALDVHSEGILPRQALRIVRMGMTISIVELNTRIRRLSDVLNEVLRSKTHVDILL